MVAAESAYELVDRRIELTAVPECPCDRDMTGELSRPGVLSGE
jgi:hypothetical protein